MKIGEVKKLFLWNFIILSIFSLQTFASESNSQDESGCKRALGMESGEIPVSRISASSSFDVKSTGPQNARIRQELVGGAWCPRSTIQEGVKEYLEIDFSGDYRITQTETQGRFGNGMGQEFAENFQLEYTRNSMTKWISYKDHLGKNILPANTNTYIGVIQKLIPPIIASKIRFIPHSIHPRTICMRVEAYGCPYTDGVLSYESPQGYWKKNPDVDLRDVFYDGWMDEDEILRGGLGLLTDSLFGPHDFRTPLKSNMWIGWDNELEPVKIGFQFDALRKFSSVKIHVNNLVSQGVQIFSSVDIYFSVDGQKYTEFPMRWIPKGEFENEKAHLINIPLRGRLASSIRLEFFHSNHWLLISEIIFKSVIYAGEVTDEILSLTYSQNIPEDEPENAQNSKNITSPSLNEEEESSTKNSLLLLLLIVSLSLFTFSCLSTLLCLLLRRSSKSSKLSSVLGLTPKTMSISLGPPSSLPHSEDKKSDKKTNKGGGGEFGGGGRSEEEECLYHELVYRGYAPSPLGFREEGEGRGGSRGKKNQYQRVNLGGDFNGIMKEEYLQRSHPSTPILPAKKERSHFHLTPIIPPPPPSKYRNQPVHFSFKQSPQTNLTNFKINSSTNFKINSSNNLKNNSSTNFKLTSSTNMKNNSPIPPPLFTTKSSSALHGTTPQHQMTLGYFNSPNGRTNGKGNSIGYYAATDIFHHAKMSERTERF